MAQEIDEQTLTAYALGELDGVEHAVTRAQLEAALAGDERVRRQVEDIRATAQWISAELTAEHTPGLSDIQHAAIERKLAWAGAAERGSLSLRPRRNWALWGSLAASIAIVCTVMASVLPRLYHMGNPGKGDGGGELPAPATGAAPYIVQSNEPATPAEQTKPTVSDPRYDPAELRAFPNSLLDERGENAFVPVADAPLAAVPTQSSYPEGAAALALIARSLDNHKLPAADSLRTDEIINALPYHYAPPTDGQPISTAIEVAGCPWNASHRLLRIGLRTADAPPTTGPSTAPAEAAGVDGLVAHVEFNPARAGAYRLIGYESGASSASLSGAPQVRSTHSLPAGRSITVLYEVIPAGMAGPSPPLAAPRLKYQKLTPVAQASQELATVSLQYRDPASAAPTTREVAVTDEGIAFGSASDDFKAAAGAAAFGLKLLDSAYKVSATYDLTVELLARAAGSEPTGVAAQLMALAQKAKDLSGSGH